MRRGMITLGAALILSLAPMPVGAQAQCRFVLGFANLAARLGPETVGRCVENQRTITGKEDFVLSEEVTVRLPVGTAVQRTTTGVLTWLPQPNLTEFADANGSWTLVPTGVAFKGWSQITSEANSASAPVPAPPARSQAAPRASCETLALELTEDAPRSTTERLTAVWGPDDVTTAAEDLCSEAAASHGARGVSCFETAFAAALGRERLFPGQGWAAYGGAYDRCIAGR